MSKLKQLYGAIYDIIAPDQMTLWEMTNLSPKHTGLDQHIWMSGKGHAKHGPRVKVSNVPNKFDDKDSFSISVDHEPQHRAGSIKIRKEHYEKIKDWIKMNHDFLHKAWHSDTMDSEDHLNGIKKL